MEDFTPRQIVAELDKYIVGQGAAKRAVAIALRNRYRRGRLQEEMRDEVIPKNILMIGPTGVGKTEIARRIARLAKAPFVKVEASKFTEVGYVGRDVDSIIRDLMQTAVRMVESERMEAVSDRAEELAVERIVDRLLHPAPPESGDGRPGGNPWEMAFGSMGQLFIKGQVPRPGGVEAPPPPPQPSASPEEGERRAGLRRKVLSGEIDEETVEVEVESAASPAAGGFGPGGMEEMMMNVQDALGGMIPKPKKRRRMTVKEAKKALAAEEARKLVETEDVTSEALRRVEQRGIVFLDEIDKIAGGHGREGRGGPDVSREGVQRDLLPIIEGSTVNTRYGPVKTDYILFVAAGAFHVSKPSDLIPELQGRLPLRVELEALGQADFIRILTEPEGALTKQYKALMATEGVELEFTEEGIAEIAQVAQTANEQAENIGARRLHTVMERLLEEVSFNASEMEGVAVTVDAAFV
ncbi:MAG: ATP-dependent protease ATPase subunit HslU, partial [Armatimonadetes bacterium]|nr:ATP-dependent protease ATPase subunit HslU [Armatimonadota bacterium]